MMRRHVRGSLLLPALIASVLAAGVARGEDAGPIEDNSFLIEEAYNQGPRVVQHIVTWMRPRGGGVWEAGFTQEWPAASQRHQVSYTIPVHRLPGSGGGELGLGDVALHYRFQWLGIGGGSVAFAPRVSVLLPTGDASRGFGEAGAGLQFNLPHSQTLAPRWVMHTNAGLTLVREGRVDGISGSPPVTVSGSRTYHLGMSWIWLATPRLNFMLEALGERTELSRPEESVLISPGVRWSHDFASGLQIVPGIAVPIGIGPSRGDRSILLYVSFEHGF